VGIAKKLLRENWLILLVVSAVAVAFLALRTTESDVGSIAQVNAMLAGGRPTLVEFYSNT
jgi:hypothetical protein